MMDLSFVVIGIISGLILTFFVGVICYKSYDNLMCNHWIPQTIISGLIIISITACMGKIDDTNMSIKKSIKNTITANYDNVLDYHNYKDNKTFVSGDSKYTFDYDEETKTLTVFTDTSSSVDAVFVDGEKQDNQKASDKTDKKKNCVSYKTNDKVDTDNASPTTTAATDTDLQQKIQDKIQSKYNGAVMTSFDTINLSGTFSCDNIQYNFAYKDNMLEVSNINDINDVTYYKISN